MIVPLSKTLLSTSVLYVLCHIFRSNFPKKYMFSKLFHNYRTHLYPSPQMKPNIPIRKYSTLNPETEKTTVGK